MPRTPDIDIASRIELLIPQYANAARMQALSRRLIKLAQDEIVTPLLALERAMNPDESSGILLDWIGERIGMPRPFVRSSDAEYFGFRGTVAAGGRTWGHAPFWSLRAHTEDVEPVGDATYRSFLKARARRLRGGANRETQEAVLAILFGNGYLDESTDPIRLVVKTENDIIWGLAAGREFHRVIPVPAGRRMNMHRS